MAERMTADLVCDALQMAVYKRKRPKGVIFHSDRGSQYCSHAYRQLLEKHQIRGSMSAKGNCYDNACAESFFHSLKVEAIHGEHFKTRDAMRQTVFEYIEIDYNRVRLHSANGYQSPVVFEAGFYQKLASWRVHFWWGGSSTTLYRTLWNCLLSLQYHGNSRRTTFWVKYGNI